MAGDRLMLRFFIELIGDYMQVGKHFWGWVLLFVSFVWGIEFSLIHNALDFMGPTTFNTVRFGVSIAVLQFYFSVTKFSFIDNLNKETIHHGVVLGLFLSFGFSTQSIGMQYTTASNAGFITGLNVLLVPIITLLWLKQPQRWYVWLGVAMALVGTLLLTGGISGFGLGETWVLGCAFGFAAHIVYTGVYAKQVNPLALTQVQLITVTLFSLLAAAIFEQESLLNAPTVMFGNGLSEEAITIWLAIIIGSVLGTCLAFVAQTIGQQTLESWRVALIYATEPLFAALGGFLLLGEILGIYAWIGAAFIIGGMLVAELVEDKKI
ncbi:MAG: drug/metabolite transporter (DMT)-like permease [Oceanicoccus sp.]|jgi:drug/metabolite transporter (DMT)-like permease